MTEKPDTNLVGMLRQRTVEEDLKLNLRTTMGGYTKRSVTEYMNQLREQQLKYAETFNRNMQNILEEKEALKKENEQLLLKITKAESDFQALTESLKVNELENHEDPDQDALALRNNLSAVEAENRELKNAERQLQARAERLEHELTESQTQTEKAKQETRSLCELLALEKKETVKQRELVALYAGIIEELQEEARRYKQVLSEGEMAKLRIKISELMANAALKEEIIDRYKTEAQQKSDALVTLTDETGTLQNSLEQLKSTVLTLTVQNEKLMSANTALEDTLEAENKRIIRLLTEKSVQTVEKLIAVRQLDELNLKLSLQLPRPESAVNVPQKAEADDDDDPPAS
jgi:chromosome segregation ATPase